jgi:hypothetical protein
MKLKFDQFNVEIEDPEIIINPVVKEVNPIKMTIDVDVILIQGKSKFGVRLTDVSVQNLTYTAETLQLRVTEHLRQFEV